MPELRPIPEPPVEDLESKLGLPSEVLSDFYALELVRRTFSAYENWRSSNMDPKWRSAVDLYIGKAPARVWEGTNIPRASISEGLLLEKIEAAVPQIVQALFWQEPWFDVIPVPIPGAPVDPAAMARAANDIRDHLVYALSAATNEFGMTAMAELELAIKDVLLFGTGFVMIEYDPAERIPRVRWVDPRDIYVDPDAPLPILDSARSVVHRQLLTIEELDAMRNTRGMNIPPADVLYTLAEERSSVRADSSRLADAASRGLALGPRPPKPADRYVEVLVYWSKSRVIWVLGRKHVAYNQPNPYGIIPYCSAPCFTGIRQFYGISFAEVVGDIQLYIQALRNLRLDELNLALTPPRIRKRGAGMMNPGGDKWRPGAVVDLDNPREDMVVMFPQNITNAVVQEIAMLEMAAEKRTGVNAMAVGVPRPSNANRTASGMSLQMQGAVQRLSGIVARIENYMIGPMLNKAYRIVRANLSPEMTLPTGKGEVPAVQFMTPVRFELRSASRMMSREALRNAIPSLLQFIMQGPFLQELARTGMTVDWNEMFDAVKESLGLDRKLAIIRPMTEEEKQAMAQANAQAAVDLQKAQLEAQTRLQMGQLKAQTELVKAQLDYQARTSETEERSAREIVRMLNENEKLTRELAQQREQLLAQLFQTGGPINE